MNLTFNQSYEKNRKGNRFSLRHKKKPNLRRGGDSGKPFSGDRNILPRTSFGQDGPQEGLNKEKPCAFSALFLHFHLLLYVNRNILTLPTHTSFGRGKLASLGQDGPQKGA